MAGNMWDELDAFRIRPTRWECTRGHTTFMGYDPLREGLNA